MLEQEFQLKTNIPCKVVTKKGMIIAGSKIVSIDENKIKFDNHNQTEVDISDILSIKYMEEAMAILEEKKKKAYAFKVRREKEEQEAKVRLMWKWSLIIFATFVVVIGIAMNVKTVDEKIDNKVQTTNLNQNLEEIVSGKFSQIKEGMTLEEINKLMEIDGELIGESTEGGIHYESYSWGFGKTENINYQVTCDFENGKSTVWGVMDSKGFRNSLGESTSD